jgi:hypothetical protein
MGALISGLAICFRGRNDLLDPEKFVKSVGTFMIDSVLESLAPSATW